jgi:hypothetical protein
MKNKFQNKILIVIILLLLLSINNVFAQRSWDVDSNEAEDEKWVQSIENWVSVIGNWDNNRDKLHEEYYGSINYDDYAKGCYNGECWEESMFDLIISRDSYKLTLEKGDCDVSGTFYNQDYWYCSNAGQGIKFNAASGEKWISDNFGQELIYQDDKGNKWRSNNIGQDIEFNSANGEKWESSNFGQEVKHNDTSGTSWSGSDDDDADDIE